MSKDLFPFIVKNIYQWLYVYIAPVIILKPRLGMFVDIYCICDWKTSHCPDYRGN